MAPRKPLFMSAEGFHEEMALSDTATFGGLTLGGDIAMGGNNITGLGDGVNPQDAVNKSQLDQAVISGGSFKEMLLTADQLDDTEGILAAMGVYFANQPSSGNTVTVTDGTTTRTYGAGTGGDVQFTIGATVWDTMQNFATAVAGDGSASWTAVATQEMDEINANGMVFIIDDASTAAVQNPIRVYGTFTTQADLQVVEYSDGTTPDGDYTNNTSSTASTTDPGNGRVGVQRQASALVDGEIHYVRVQDTIYGWDDSDNTWQQLSGASSIPDATSASGGGIKGKITVDSDFGLSVSSGVLKTDIVAAGAGVGGLEYSGGDLQVNVDTNSGMELTANGVAIDLAATNPGLTFESGDLAVLVGGANGIIRGSTGLEIEIDDTPDTLDVGAAGLKVVGLPSSFKVNDVATNGTYVTAANLDTLTDGSDASALHTHTGADEAQRIENDIAVDEALVAGDPVYWTATGDRVGKGRADTDSKSRIVGVTRVGQAVVGNDAVIVSQGPALGAISLATAGNPYYLQATGGVGTGVPGGGNRVILCGYAMNADDLWVTIHDYGKKAV